MFLFFFILVEVSCDQKAGNYFRQRISLGELDRRSGAVASLSARTRCHGVPLSMEAILFLSVISVFLMTLSFISLFFYSQLCLAYIMYIMKYQTNEQTSDFIAVG